MASMAVSTVANPVMMITRYIRIDLMNPTHDFHAVHARHLKIEQNDMGFPAAEDFEAFLATRGAVYLTSHAAQDSFRSFPNAVFIVNHQDFDVSTVIFHGGSPHLPLC
jgi:hypothetical protein